MKFLPRIAKVDVFRAEGIPVGPALTSQLTVMAAIGRQDDQALSARIPFMAAGPSKARTLQAAYMTATVSMPHPPQNSLALACERGPYMTGWKWLRHCPTQPYRLVKVCWSCVVLHNM